MKRHLLTILFSVSLSLLFGQNPSNYYYWIKLKDKNNNPYSLNNPTQFLSQRSIDRRVFQGIPLDITDLPITPAYIDSIQPYTTEIIHQLKWFNIVVVMILDTSGVQTIKRMPFVDSMDVITSYPYKSLLTQNKFESVTPVDQQIIYPDIHGIAYHQLNMMNGDLLHQLGFKGNGVLISMMDNGCLSVDNLPAFDSVRPRILDSWNFSNNQKSIYADSEGVHGTYTFSCIAANLPNQYVGSAPEASFVLFHTEDNYAEWVMEEYHWAAAAERADSDGAQIFTTSLGYNNFDGGVGSHTYADLTGNKTIMTLAGNIAFGKGILVFNSAGNEGNNSWHYIVAPADGDSIIAVGAVDSARRAANFSSRGPSADGRIKPDLCAQGAGASIVGAAGNLFQGGGTSFSCPILAGCAACLWQAFPSKTAREIKDAIMISADRFWYPSDSLGYGIPNFYNAYLLLKTNYNGNILRLSEEAAVYPTPFSDQLNVSLYNAVEGTRTIELFDISGKKVLSQQVFLRQNTFEIVTLDGAIGGLAAGQYFLRLDGQKKFAHPVIKAR